MENHKVIGVTDHPRFPFGGSERRFHCLFHPMQGYVGEQGANHAPLRSSLRCGGEFQIFHHSGFEPAFYGSSHCGVGGELLEQCLVVDVIEAAFYVCVQDILALLADTAEDGSNGIEAGPSRAESVAIWLEWGLPLWFQRLFSSRLPGSVVHCGNPKWPLPLFPAI